MIVADYMASGPNMPRMLARFGSWPRYRDHMTVMPPDVYAVKERPMRWFLSEIEARHGSVQGWAFHNGISLKLQARLTAQLLED